MKYYKSDILAILKRNKKAKEAGLIIGVPGMVYTVTISNISSVYVECINGIWKAWRETHYPTQKKPVSTKIIATGSTFNYVISKLKRYLEYIIQKKEE